MNNRLKEIQYSIKHEISKPFKKLLKILFVQFPDLIIGSPFSYIDKSYKIYKEAINLRNCYFGNSSYLLDINKFIKFDPFIIDKFESMLGVEIIENK